jgi:hypothetical protein
MIFNSIACSFEHFLMNISIDAQDETALAAFLKSLTEDYETPLPVWKR